MSWLKRNLYFLIGGGVAVALLAVAGFYFFSKWSLNKQNLQQLDEAYNTWEQLTMQTPNPGNDKIDNTQMAREQQEQVRAVIKKVQRYFMPIPPVPDTGDRAVTSEEFAAALRRTVDQLQRVAANTSVTVPPRYGFSFEAERQTVKFSSGSLGPLSVQLGEVKGICDVLFNAKINSLDNLRRERVASEDQNGPQSDYLDPTIIAVTNDLAVLVPYEITFQCFSAELAGVLTGFGTSSHGFIVKAINVDSSGGLGAGAMTGTPGGMLGPGYISETEMATRLGYAQPPATAAATPGPRGGLPTLLDEKQVKVTLVLNVVRLLPKK